MYIMLQDVPYFRSFKVNTSCLFDKYKISFQIYLQNIFYFYRFIFPLRHHKQNLAMRKNVYLALAYVLYLTGCDIGRKETEGMGAPADLAQLSESARAGMEALCEQLDEMEVRHAAE